MFRNLKQLVTKAEKLFAKLPLWLHALAALLAVVVVRAANSVLDVSYAASKFPVPFMEGQLAFDGALIKSYYATMIEQGTLGIYVQTQLIDFAYIASVFVAGLVVPLLIARLYASGSWLQKVSLAMAAILPMGALFDTLENLVSFVMLSMPQSFPDWIAPIYSSFAALKFACLVPGYTLVGVLAVGAVVAQLVKLVRRPHVQAVA